MVSSCILKVYYFRGGGSHSRHRIGGLYFVEMELVLRLVERKSGISERKDHRLFV